jgi:hypothetical protein
MPGLGADAGLNAVAEIENKTLPEAQADIQADIKIVLDGLNLNIGMLAAMGREVSAAYLREVQQFRSVDLPELVAELRRFNNTLERFAGTQIPAAKP